MPTYRAFQVTGQRQFELVERDVVHLCLSVDHDIVDGAPLMRFAERFKQLLREGTVLA